MSAAEQCPECGAVVGGWFEKFARWITRNRVAPTIDETTVIDDFVKQFTTRCRRCRHLLGCYMEFGPFEVTLPVA